MKLNSPVTMTLPGLGERTFTDLAVALIDVSALRIVRAQMPPFYKTLTLWEGDAYDAVGDYTQAQAEARIIELLGDDPKSVLEGLYVQIPAK